MLKFQGLRGQRRYGLAEHRPRVVLMLKQTRKVRDLYVAKSHSVMLQLGEIKHERGDGVSVLVPPVGAGPLLGHAREGIDVGGVGTGVVGRPHSHTVRAHAEPGGLGVADRRLVHAMQRGGLGEGEADMLTHPPKLCPEASLPGSWRLPDGHFPSCPIAIRPLRLTCATEDHYSTSPR
jgi:hypothetical protein